MIAESAAFNKVRRWKFDPLYFVTQELRATPDRWQEKVLADFPDPKKQRIAMQACVGPGKSTVLSWCILNFMACYGGTGAHPKGAAVSITSDNLKDNLWAELAVWRERSEFLKAAFELNSEQLYARSHPDTWFFSARSWPKQADAERQGRTLSGLHAKYVLAVIDESGDIPPSVGRAAEQALSNCQWGKILQAGNPSSLDGMLYAAAKTMRHLWTIHRITGDPDDPERSPRIGLDWAKEQIETYGRDNPWIMSTILGHFPPASINSLLGPDEVADAMKRQLKEEEYIHAQKRLGIDPARFGDDRTVLFPRQGLAAFQPVEMRNARGPEVAARVCKAEENWHHEIEFIDDTGGYGSSVIDSLLQAKRTPIPVNFSSKAADPRYFNKRAEMWFLMAEWVKRGGSLPNIPQLSRELTAPTYTFHNGKFRLEEKDQIKTRLKFSPDMADALACTFFIPDMPARNPITAQYQEGWRAASDWNPFDRD